LTGARIVLNPQHLERSHALRVGTTRAPAPSLKFKFRTQPKNGEVTGLAFLRNTGKLTIKNQNICQRDARIVRLHQYANREILLIKRTSSHDLKRYRCGLFIARYSGWNFLVMFCPSHEINVYATLLMACA
jgi:hypothetical protein